MSALTCPRCRSPVPQSRVEDLRRICPRCLVESLIAPESEEEARSPLEHLEGQELGNYVVGKLIGVGGMGAVYRAHQKGLDRTVALKVLNPQRLARREEIARFLSEARSAARLKHPNIVTVHEVASDRGCHFFAMDYIDGGSLGDALYAKQCSPRRSAEILAKVARALDHAHARGIIHRDVKPHNILIDRGGEPRIMDFGVARDSSREVQLTATGVTLGTPAYMSPEQAASQSVDARSDVYSLGATLYECLTGQPPFCGASAGVTLQKVLDEEPVPPRSLRDSVPRDLETISLKALQKDPVLRYSTAQAMAEDLERFLEGRPVAGRSALEFRRVSRFIRRHAILTGFAAACLVLGSILTWVGFSKRSREATQRASEEARRQARGPLEKGRQLVEDARRLTLPTERAQREDRLDRAATQLETAAALAPDWAEPRFWLARVFHERGRWSRAVDAYSECLRLDPDHPQARYFRILANYAVLNRSLRATLGCLDVARRAAMVDDLKSLEHLNVPADWIETASGLLATTDVEEYYRTMIAGSEAFAKTHAKMADRLMAYGDHVVALNSGNGWGPFLRALSLGHRRSSMTAPDPSYAEAVVSEFRRSISLEPNELIFHLELAATLMDAGRASEAFQAAEQAAIVAPQCADAYVMRGGLAVGLGRSADGWTDLDRALELADTQTIVRMARAGLLLSPTGDPEEMERALDHLTAETYARVMEEINAGLKASPDDPALLMERGRIRVTSGRDFEKGKADLRRFIAVYPDHPLRRFVEMLLESEAEDVDPVFTFFRAADVAAKIEPLLGTEQGRRKASRRLARWHEMVLGMDGLSEMDRVDFSHEFAFWIVVILAMDGEKQLACEDLRELLGHGWRDWKRFDMEPRLDALRKDPRILDLRQKFPPLE